MAERCRTGEQRAQEQLEESALEAQRAEEEAGRRGRRPAKSRLSANGIRPQRAPTLETPAARRPPAPWPRWGAEAIRAEEQARAAQASRDEAAARVASARQREEAARVEAARAAAERAEDARRLEPARAEEAAEADQEAARVGAARREQTTRAAAAQFAGEPVWHQTRALRADAALSRQVESKGAASASTPDDPDASPASEITESLAPSPAELIDQGDAPTDQEGDECDWSPVRNVEAADDYGGVPTGDAIAKTLDADALDEAEGEDCEAAVVEAVGGGPASPPGARGRGRCVGRHRPPATSGADVAQGRRGEDGLSEVLPGALCRGEVGHYRARASRARRGGEGRGP